ncbi:MAG: cyclic nucleotide-binding domain-containing protein [Mariprofundaceae bacterium]|nr:cyclic nucleotide-binding domain-containing protein [Mariprofundaceae bacterium]
MHHPLWSNLFRDRHDWVKKTSTMCEQNPLFTDVSSQSIRWLASRMHLRRYDKDEVVFRMGDPGAGAVLLLSGKVQIRVNDVVVASLQQGDLFGEVALATNLPRTAEAVTMAASELVFFLRSDLKEWMETSPKQASKLLLNLANMLAHRLMQSNERYARTMPEIDT